MEPRIVGNEPLNRPFELSCLNKSSKSGLSTDLADHQMPNGAYRPFIELLIRTGQHSFEIGGVIPDCAALGVYGEEFAFQLFLQWRHVVDYSPAVAGCPTFVALQIGATGWGF